MIKFTKKLGLLILVVVLLQNELKGKMVTDKIRVPSFNRKSWKYITKFQLNIGTGKYRFRIKLDKPISREQNPPQVIPI